MFSTLTAEALSVIRKMAGEGCVESGNLWQFPREKERGDVATSVALSLSKKLKQKPQDIARNLAEALKKVEGVARVEVMDPGYVNVWLMPEALMEELQVTEGITLPAKVQKEEAPVIIDYAGPNIAKPLGIHHILSTVIGQAIVNVYRHLGLPVIGWSYPGDWGTQFGKLAVAFEKWGTGKAAADYSIDELLTLYVRFHQEAEHDPALEDQGRAVFARLEAGDARLRAFWKDVVAVSRQSLEKLYRRLHVTLDVETGESFYEDKMASILEEGKKKGVFTIGEGGALIVRFPADTLPPYLLQKSDGSTLYATRDLAMVRYRIDTYHPQTITYVVDVAQSLHFQQLFATVQMLGWDAGTLEHALFGRMRFADASMSTRKGTVVKLEDVLDEGVKRAKDVIAAHRDTIQTDDEAKLAEMMGVGAVVYGILSQNRRMDIVFDWDKMLSFEGNSAPYLQYTHARARSVLRKAEEGVPREGSAPLRGEKRQVPAELTPRDRLLLRTLLRYPAVLEEVRETHLPHKLTNFLFELCQDFNKFYNTDSILKAEEASRSFRLQLTACTADVLKSGAEILTLRVPDRM